MDNSLKGLILAAGTLVTCAVISLAFFLSRGSRDIATSAYNQISKLNAEFNESDKVMYDGLDVPGSEVLNSINKFKNEELSIIVETKKSVVHYGHSINNANDAYSLGVSISSNVIDAKNIKSASYINQNALFNGEIIRDINNTIIGIKFTQV